MWIAGDWRWTAALVVGSRIRNPETFNSQIRLVGLPVLSSRSCGKLCVSSSQQVRAITCCAHATFRLVGLLSLELWELRKIMLRLLCGCKNHACISLPPSSCKHGLCNCRANREDSIQMCSVQKLAGHSFHCTEGTVPAASGPREAGHDDALACDARAGNRSHNLLLLQRRLR